MTISLENVGSGFKRSVINDNFTAIQDEINNNLLDKAGGKPLTADLDFNGNSLLNASSVATSSLTINGNNVTPQELAVSSLPDQTGNGGRVLVTDGSGASWGDKEIEYFESVSALKTKSLPSGRIVATKQYYSSPANTGEGAAFYKILTAVEFGATPDGYGDHVLANGNVAKLLKGRSVNVTQYGATTLPSSQTAYIQACVDAVQNSGGGEVVIDQAYQIGGVGISVTKKNVTINGVGYKGQLYRQDGNSTFILDVELDLAAVDQIFNVSKLTIVGNTVAPVERGLRLQNINSNSRIEMRFIGLQTCVQLGDVYSCVFNLGFRLYELGIVGTAGKASNNNYFESCVWFDGTSNVSANQVHPIVPTNMGYNTFDTCNIEARGSVGVTDMSLGTGNNVFHNLRLEQLNNSEDDWLILGDRDKVITCNLFQSATYKIHSSVTDYWGIICSGTGSVIENLFVDNEYAGHILKLDTSSNSCKVSVSFSSGASNHNNAVMDLGTDNKVEYENLGYMYNGTDTWSDGFVNQWIEDSAEWSTVVADGVTQILSTGTATAPEVKGPHDDGYVRKITVTGGNRRFSWNHNVFSGYTYNFSIWVYSSTEVDIELFANASFKEGYKIPANKWVRVFLNYDSPSTVTIPFGVRAPNSAVFFASAPQLTERLTSATKVGPSGYVRSGVFSGGLTYLRQYAPRLNERRVGTSAPLAGLWHPPQIVHSLEPDAGTTGIYAYACVTAGSPGTWVDLKHDS